jgi:hypothetical protein
VPPAVPASQALVARVKKLVELGSRPMEIRASLTKEGIPPEQIQAAMAAASQMVRGEQGRQVRKLWGWLAVVAVVLPLAIWGAVRLASPLAARREDLAEAIRSTLVPNAASSMGMTTPVVQQLEGGPAGTCPGTPAEAAALFGGRAETWSRGSNGWIRIDTSGEDATIYVPAGMLAMYFKVTDQLLIPVEVEGPATLSGAPGLAISCP